MIECVPLDINVNKPPSPIGFEGFEKRIEISFSEPPIFKDPKGLGLRALTRSQINAILEAACCTIVSHLSNSELDSYVLSESSLFVQPYKIVLKTCGTTRLLLSIKPILELAASLSLSVFAVKYSRGTFIFPNDQHAPHNSFIDEVSVLNYHFAHLHAEAYVMGDSTSPNGSWHIYSACIEGATSAFRGLGTVEMCMTGLDRDKARVFYKEWGRGKMTEMSRVCEINPSHVICDFEFHPCGYSMNGIEGGAFSTVHVTPEDGFSYASYEAEGLESESIDLGTVVRRVVECFGPAEFSVAVTCNGGAEGWAMSNADVEGYWCENVVKQDLPGKRCIVYLTYSAMGRGGAMRTPQKAIL
ncbi:S-adenosylmethionine decarboxylase proenzyme-like [Abrus precatorius]|uniref:S-adenosylmethionine decarboxylase proenzyme n=1 Tax=Abrus precatorius TaxID=3816 RepID=A0A8B8JRC9_ABRPR|nr:S-adenosylmethionine decarboxylase proenzyme-like [Abrus precatorius]